MTTLQTELSILTFVELENPFPTITTLVPPWMLPEVGVTDFKLGRPVTFKLFESEFPNAYNWFKIIIWQID